MSSLNFPLLLLSAAKLQLQESWQEPSFDFSIHAACRPLVWFFHEMRPKLRSCCSSVSESPPAWFLRPEHDPSRAQSQSLSGPLAFTEGALILCPQPPTARCHLHGKLFWLVSDRWFVYREQRINYLWTVLIYLQECDPSKTADQRDYQQHGRNKYKTCFSVCIQPPSAAAMPNMKRNIHS